MKTFEELSQRRRNYVAAAQDNGFEDGLRNLLADLYPDNAHFIYELLQNAEDAGASEVTFELQLDGLKVEHDGKRLFDLRDIASITGIGQSTKPDDETKIGKFGVGFKAVFAYTQTPVIHSGEYSFAIQNLFMPVRIPADVRPGKTTFWFPFDRPDKPAEIAFKEVETALRDIASSTLLFLNSIQMIGCFLHGGDERLLQRRQLDDHIIEIDSVNEEEGATFWYRVTRDVAIDGKILPIAAAFALESSATEKKSKKRFKVRPIDGKVFIYFPADNENSGLKFHVHAPFASTVARDSIREDPGNEELVKGIAALIADSLPEMCEMGLMTDGLLEALPNHNDELPERFEVVRDRIVETFGHKPLTPMVGGGYAPSELLIRAETPVRTVLDVSDGQLLLSLDGELEGENILGWLPDRDGRAGNLLDSLYAQPFGRKELTEVFESISQTDLDQRIQQALGHPASPRQAGALAIWHAWIGRKSDNWVREFYVMLGGLGHKSRMLNDPLGQGRRRYLAALRLAPLFRVQGMAGVEHVGSASAYLPVAPGLRRDGLLVDHLAVFEGSEDQSTLRLFYDLAEVKTWDAAAQLDKSLQSYTDQPAEITDKHLGDLKSLTHLIAEKKVSPIAYQNHRIFVADGHFGSKMWMSAKGLYLDAPHANTGLGSLYESNEYMALPINGSKPFPLDSEYDDSPLDVRSLAVLLGAQDDLKIERVSVRRNSSFQWGWVDRENKNMDDFDWDIPFLNIITSVGDEVLLRELWRVVTTSPQMYADAVYRAHGSARRYSMPSQLLVKLQSKPWILDRDGNLRLPEDITENELAEGLDLPKNSHLLERSGFARKAKANADRRQEQSVVAKELGFDSADDIRRLAEIRNINPHKFKDLVEDLEAALKLPEASTSVPERRGRRAGDAAADASLRQYERKVRSVYVQVPGHLSNARGYLQTLYTNDDRIMFCQVCNMPMPFKLNGRFYFEAVQFVSDSRHELHENRLALCPTCAAKYRHARETTLDDLRDDLLTQEIGDQRSISVDVVLAGEAAKVRFVGKHAIDLQAALESTTSVLVEDGEGL